MLFAITLKQVTQLDMPVFNMEGDDCVVVFTAEHLARFFMQGEPNEKQLAVAEIQIADIPELFQNFSNQSIEKAVVNPRPRNDTYTSARILNVKDLVGLSDEEIFAKILNSELISDTERSTDNKKSNFRIKCNRCGREETVALNDTLPFCCDQIMRPAILQNSTLPLES